MGNVVNTVHITRLTEVEDCMLTSVRMSVKENLAGILARVSAAYGAGESSVRAVSQPRLVAVSKTKPKEMLIQAYQAGQRDFGENYVAELVEKSQDQEMLSECPEIRWHFIGNCQTNKVKTLLSCPNLSVIETVTSSKLATTERTVGVFVQVNTSGEQNKNGLEPGSVLETVQHIREKCPKLKFSGLMTIGNLGNSLSATKDGGNPDFQTLREVRREVSQQLNVPESEIELSMGMSNDFEEAIKCGSTNVRVGSSIFGARDYSAKETPPVVNTINEELNKTEEKLEKVTI